MKLGSLFDGSGTAPLAATMCGIVPAWASEIEPYPLKITSARFPNMIHLGDITKIDGATVEPVDIVCGGSPCQDLSVAGQQAGLHEGDRSRLFFEMTRIIKEMRGATNGQYPRFIVWENVPGAFSSNKGADFLAVLQSFAEIADPFVHVPEPERKAGRLVWKYSGEMVGDGWSIAWRTLDAQYWGVPQRRRRIFLVADFRGGCAGEILFERDGLCGDFAQSGSKRKGPAGDAENGVGAAGFKAGTGAKAGGIGYSEEISPTVVAASSGTNQAPTVVYCLQGNGIDRALTAGCNGKGWRENESYTLNTIDRPAVVFQTYQKVTGPLMANSHPGSYTGQDAFSDMLVAGPEPSVVFDKEVYNSGVNANGGHFISEDGFAPTLRTKHPPGVCVRHIVRRLTPLECCRLQGFPDHWMDDVDGSDSAKYKMWGNGMALPCMLYVMEGIANVKDVVRPIFDPDDLEELEEFDELEELDE